jgi:hypothetical protein
MEEDNNNKDISISKLANLKLEIVRFDTQFSTAYRRCFLQTLVWDFIANTRDTIFRLQQSLHGLDNIDFTSGFERPYWSVVESIADGRKSEEAAI